MLTHLPPKPMKNLLLPLTVAGSRPTFIGSRCCTMPYYQSERSRAKVALSPGSPGQLYGVSTPPLITVPECGLGCAPPRGLHQLHHSACGGEVCVWASPCLGNWLTHQIWAEQKPVSRMWRYDLGVWTWLQAQPLVWANATDWPQLPIERGRLHSPCCLVLFGSCSARAQGTRP